MGTLEQLWTYVEQASPEVQAQLYGNTALLLTGLLGLLVTAGVTLWQLRAQRIEAAKDRALALKKEVLLDAVRGAYEVYSSLGALAEADATLDQVRKNYRLGAGKLFAASGVASLQTVESGKRFLMESGPRFLSLLVEKWPVEKLRSNHEIAQKLIDNQIADNKVALDMQRGAIANNDGGMVQRLQGIFEAGHRNVVDLGAERDRHHAEFSKLSRLLLVKALELQREVDPFLQELVAAIRVDVGLEESREAFLAVAKSDEARFRSMRKKLDETLDRMEEMEMEDKGDKPAAG